MATKEIKPKRPPKTLKERRFVKEYLKTGNATQAVVDAGYKVKNRLVARNIGAENVAKLGMNYWFSKAGLTEETLAQNTTRIALTAKKVWGTGDDFIEIEDNPTQLKAMQFASELMGLKQVEGVANTYFQFISSQKDIYGDSV